MGGPSDNCGCFTSSKLHQKVSECLETRNLNTEPGNLASSIDQ